MILMKKASIRVKEGSGGLLGAVISALGLDDSKCLFNPSEFSIQRGVSYAEHKVPGLDRPIMQFINGEAEVMRFSLFFDTYSAGFESGSPKLGLTNKLPTMLKDDVRNYTDPFYKLLNVSADLHVPNLVMFEWGKTKFTGYVIDITQKFTMFSSGGTPLRATLDFTLKSAKKDDNVRNSPDRTKYRTVHSGDMLFAFANAEYGDCGEWRRIAEANGLDNPRRLRSGSSIVIPAIL